MDTSGSAVVSVVERTLPLMVFVPLKDTVPLLMMSPLLLADAATYFPLFELKLSVSPPPAKLMLLPRIGPGMPLFRTARAWTVWLTPPPGQTLAGAQPVAVRRIWLTGSPAVAAVTV